MLIAGPALAADAEDRLVDLVRETEQALGARVGLVVRDSGSNWSWDHRADERFLMNSTLKAPLCGAVLAQVDAGAIDLDEALPVRPEDMVDYAPVTENEVGGTMSVDDLCLAALDMSDNAATNIVIDRLGGPQEVTTFLRGIGDEVTRLDRKEPDVNTFDPADPRDTTTPEAMTRTLEALLAGDALSAGSRARLTAWMTPGGVTGAHFRAHVPRDWRIADKSGAGDFTRNIVAMITPPGAEPYFVAIYLSGADADFETRNAAVIALSAAVVDVISAR
ncbi:class A beta-lactamase [Roseivivax isoporae]|uniref:Beta-lactamase n=1 Tax=Roseivivax isoporae LMG 25204 TaxID=1449351 RepID=X7F2J9_9RHOB|nr:class A beta-lactamase [Roseivivax isoporae]ETX26958.1 beta-lactamase [Roseivivax isoporae LMG 25204]